MAYQVLSLKWRPQSFADVVGQDHVTQTLNNAFKKDRIAQAYLFTGPRGVGKTTTARILSKALNCLESPGNPCNKCTNCKEITAGRNMDVLEIDGASNRGIEEIRNLRELIKYSPVNGEYKIFIIDEVHMLTGQAFNALLLTLEEPPPHGKFILATTDVHKVPATIISRCQRFDFNRITNQVIIDRLRFILDQESLSMDDDSLQLLARKADGSMRDALSIMDQIIAYCGETIAYDDVVKVLGIVPYDQYFGLSTALTTHDGERVIDYLAKTQATGTPVSEIVVGITEHIRNLLIATVDGGEEVLEMNRELRSRYRDDAQNWDRRDLLRILQILTDVEPRVKRATQPHILFETTLMKLLEMDASVSIDQILSGGSGGKSTPSKKESQSVRPQPAESVSNSDRTKSRKPDIEPTRRNQPEEKLETKSEKEPVKEESSLSGNDDDPDAKIDPDIVSAKWETVVQDVLKNRPSVGHVLEQCELQELNGRHLHIKGVNIATFEQSNLETNRRVVEQTINSVFKQDLHLKVEWETVDQPEKSIEKKTPENGGQTGGNSVKRVDENTVSKIIELFDGEILR